MSLRSILQTIITYLVDARRSLSRRRPSVFHDPNSMNEWVDSSQQSQCARESLRGRLPGARAHLETATTCLNVWQLPRRLLEVDDKLRLGNML